MEIGQMFELKYKIIKVLGTGGMSTVFLAENIKLHSYFAIKEVNKAQNEKVDLLAEPLILTKLKHSALPKIFDIVENEEYLYIIEEYIEGKTLEAELAEKKQISEATVIKWSKEICDLLKYLHNRKPNPIIYRDMKPSNLMVTPEGQIKLIDFGIAREFKQESGSDTTYMGTRGYAAPEQYGTTQTDARTDIFGLGVTLYHLITGKSPNEPPFEIKPVREFNKGLSVGIEHIIRKCTQQDPASRYQSVEDLLFDFINISEFDIGYRKARLRSRVPMALSIMLLFSSVILSGFGVNEMQKESMMRYLLTVEEGVLLNQTVGADEAVIVLKQAIDQNPQLISAYKEIAKVYLSESMYEECTSYIKAVLSQVEEASSDPDMYYISGRAQFELKEYQNAVHNFKIAVKLNPNSIDYKRDLAVCYARQGEIKKAEDLLNVLSADRVHMDVVSYIQGEIFLKNRSQDEALLSFIDCIQYTNDEALKRRAFITAGQTLSDLKGFKEEITLLERALSTLSEKNNPVIIEMLGEAYFSKAMAKGKGAPTYNADLLKAVNLFQSLLDSGLKRIYIYRNIGIIYHYMNEYSKSEAVFMEMATVFQEDYSPYYELALLYADRESLKANEFRNYSQTFKNYELAMQFSKKEQQNQEMMPLINLIDELHSKGWK